MVPTSPQPHGCLSAVLQERGSRSAAARKIMAKGPGISGLRMKTTSYDKVYFRMPPSRHPGNAPLAYQHDSR
jgi:hypothetical protein